jgi:hypothetical protein
MLRRYLCWFTLCYGGTCVGLRYVTEVPVLIYVMLRRYRVDLRYVTEVPVLVYVMLRRYLCWFTLCYGGTCVGLRSEVTTRKKKIIFD